MLAGGKIHRQDVLRQGHCQAAGALKTPPPPPVDLLLDLDEEYLEKANIDKLPKIAPKRFNPDREAWLPILKTKREDWKFTLLFSNTANARQRGKTRDWVVVYYERRGIQDQCTVVTAESGPSKTNASSAAANLNVAATTACSGDADWMMVNTPQIFSPRMPVDEKLAPFSHK